MKKLLNVFLVVMFMLTPIVFLNGCSSEPALTPKIDVVGIESVYGINQLIQYDKAIVRYYEDENSNNYTSVFLTESMVEGFDSSKEGSGTMIVSYNGLTKEIDYEIIDIEKTYKAAAESSVAQNKIEVIFHVKNDNEYSAMVAQHDVAYSCTRYGEVFERWQRTEDNKMVYYTLSNNQNTKTVTGREPMDYRKYVAGYFIINEFLNESTVTFESVTKNNENCLIIKILANLGEGLFVEAYSTIKNNLIVEVELAGAPLTVNYESLSILYNDNASEIPAIPDVEWVEQ